MAPFVVNSKEDNYENSSWRATQTKKFDCANFDYLSCTNWLDIWTNMHFTSTHLSIINDKIPEDFYGYKIAAVSDLHNHDWNGKLTEQLQKEAPDIIVITGDFVDSSHTDFGVAKKFIYEARDIAPIYYVTGNHEAWLENYDVCINYCLMQEFI